VKKELIEGHTTIFLNVTKQVESIRISAADMIWDLFSANLVDSLNQSIPIATYHIDEENQLVIIKLGQVIPSGLYQLFMDFGSQIRKDLMGCYLTYVNDTSGIRHPFIISQFEPNYARTCFPTFDEPNVKMPFTITVTAPYDLDIVSNTQSVISLLCFHSRSRFLSQSQIQVRNSKL
jgi:aminopeptidase, putative